MYDSFRPPTDNLYKFLAIFGLFLIALSVWIGWTVFWTAAEASKDAEVFRDEQIDVLSIELGKALEASFRDDEFDEGAFDSTFDASKDLESATERAEQADWKFRLTVEATAWAWIFSAILMLVGAVCSLIGFLLWYFKVQRYLDRILRAQASALLRPPRHSKRRLMRAPAR